MDFLEYKGYKGTVEYSREDDCLFGKVLGMNKDLIAYEGNTISELKADFIDGIESYLSACKADGIEPKKPFSGKLNLRMTSDLHSRIAALSLNTGIAINELINRAISRELEMAEY